MPALTIETHSSAASARLALEGELDLSGVTELERAIDEVRAEGAEQVVVDLRGLAFMDSSGLRAFVMADARARDEGWTFALVAGDEPVHRVFEITRMDERLNFVEAPE